MPTFVDPSKCDGCKGQEKTACMYICPNDLMILDPEAMKAYNQEVDACWECYSCVKICPQGAISARPYADFCPLGGVCIPLRSTDSISWTVQFRNGSLKRFNFPIRTTPEGSIKPFEGWSEGGDLDNELLFSETKLVEPKEALKKIVEVEDPGKKLVIVAHNAAMAGVANDMAERTY